MGDLKLAETHQFTQLSFAQLNTNMSFSSEAAAFLHQEAHSLLCNKQSLGSQSPHSLTKSHKSLSLSLHLFKITPYSFLVVIPDTWQKWPACFCVWRPAAQHSGSGMEAGSLNTTVHTWRCQLKMKRKNNPEAKQSRIRSSAAVKGSY